MTWTRALAVLVGAVVMATLEWGLSIQWFWSGPIAVLAYFMVRYLGYFIGVRRRMKAETEEALQAAARGREISN